MKAVLLLSGGVDSTVILYQLLEVEAEVHAVCVDYGQTHRREIAGAELIAERAGVSWEVIRVDPAPFAGSSITSGDGGVVIPNRNAVLISLAAAVAIREQFDAVAIGCNASDHQLWPDCRPEFLDAMAQVLRRCDDRRLTLHRPLVRMSKLDVVREGLRLGVPFDQTWTCYVGDAEPCGKCVACVERREAMFLAGAAW